jgi:hypothetical protein
LETPEPIGVEARIEASALHIEVREQKREHGRQQVERACYEIDLARWQYDAVDPAHRLAARELERRSKTALGNLHRIEAAVETQLKALETALTAQQQQRLRIAPARSGFAEPVACAHNEGPRACRRPHGMENPCRIRGSQRSTRPLRLTREGAFCEVT